MAAMYVFGCRPDLANRDHRSGQVAGWIALTLIAAVVIATAANFRTGHKRALPLRMI